MFENIFQKNYNAKFSVAIYCKHPYIKITVTFLLFFIIIYSLFSSFVIFDTLMPMVIKFVSWCIVHLWIWCPKNLRLLFIYYFHVFSTLKVHAIWHKSFCKFCNLKKKNFLFKKFESDKRTVLSGEWCGPWVSCFL